MGKTKILIYDSITDGHHPDYLFHLINHINSQDQIEAFIASGEAFFNEYLLHPVRKNIKWGKHLHFLPISNAKIAFLHAKPLMNRSFREYSYFVELGEKHEVDYGILMYLDYFQLGLVFGPKPSFKITGILFRPTFHLEVKGILKNIVKSFKSILLKIILKRKFVSRLYVLDSSVLSFWQNEPKLTYINEPISALTIEPSKIRDFKEKYQIRPTQKIFLNFGFLDERKGINQFLKACRLLPEDEASKICLILAGNISSSYQEHIEKQIAQTPQIKVISFFKYLDQTEYQILFEVCDVVLMLYQKHIGMSSVLVRAAAAQKPVLLENFGTLSKIALNYQLGKLVNSTYSEKLKNDLLEVLHHGIQCDPEKQEIFAKNNTPEAFASKLLGT